MQDRFKYRVFDYDDNKMHDVIEIIYREDNTVVEWLNSNNKKRSAFIGESPIVQCTGLKDKNGKLIYEGDILRYPEAERFIKSYNSEYAPKPPKVIIKYIWCRLMGYMTGMDEYQDLIDWTDYIDNTTPLEVVGNIYEHPELLE